MPDQVVIINNHCTISKFFLCCNLFDFATLRRDCLKRLKRGCIRPYQCLTFPSIFFCLRTGEFRSLSYINTE
ncbi:hypothetical protein AQUCO_02700132v1 [Aquilegia coerulea]|uniref:Uncharacterized protein n=1 Tax=Aquilegia coerulea TaxID=218851 RepID=A0A2G5D5B6_AQUCA|nr:hypothetical protein AQUCO_02700132v1 [Aquilegia coerulea]